MTNNLKYFENSEERPSGIGMHYFLKILIYVSFLVFPFSIQADTQRSQRTICLNMIVKNESSVITRCLASLLPIIDYWVIVDTGSEDGTQQVIRDFMQANGVPGELHDRPWVNFGHNRNEALKLAQGKADYLFFIDADEYLVYEPDFKLPQLDKDYYYVVLSYSGTKYSKIQLVNNHLAWEWVGVLHEVLCPLTSNTYATLEKVLNFFTTEGARSRDPNKYQKDAQVLEEALKADPDNNRYVFYLAQSYRDAGDYSLALQNYQKRADMGGWDEEVYYSLLQIGLMQKLLNLPSADIVQSFNKAYQYRRSRVEPLYHLAHFYRQKGDFASGYLVAKVAQTLPVSQDVLFVDQWMYDYGILLELSICAHYIEKYEESQQICLELLRRNNLPANVQACVQSNLGFANAKLIEQICSKAVK